MPVKIGHYLYKVVKGKRTLLPFGANVSALLQYHPALKGSVVYDEFKEAIVRVRRMPWAREIGPWSDTDSAQLSLWIQTKYGIAMPDTALNQGVVVAAHNKRVHPVREYLAKLQWDKSPRLDSFPIDYLGSTDSPYTRGVWSKWMISAVARVMRPGCQADHTIILESSSQGKRKSTLFRVLVPDPDWYSETPLSIGDKDSYQALHGVWIYCLDELDGIRRAENTRVKTYLTATQDHFRPSYGRHTVTLRRQNVFCGTTNETQYFSDTTGNRRYWPIRVGKVDLSAIKGMRDQLWAEAFTRFEAGEKWWGDDAWEALCAAEQQTRMLPDGWETPVITWLIAKKTTRVTADDLLSKALLLPADRINTSAAMRAASILRRLGFTKSRLAIAGERAIWWTRSQPLTNSDEVWQLYQKNPE